MKNLFINSIIGFIAVVTLNADDIKIQCNTPIQSFSNTDKMSSGDFSANVFFKDVNFTKNSIGYGPGKDRQYEISILEGQIYMARPAENGKTIVRHIPKDDDGGAMLQVANVEKWGEYKNLNMIDSLDSMNFELDDVVEESDCDSNLVLPFKIIGHASSVTWSMDTDNHRIDTMKNKDVVIEGIYNKKDKSKYFMVKGTNTHAHVVLTQEDLAGHLRNIVLNEGAKLYLPIK